MKNPETILAAGRLAPLVGLVLVALGPGCDAGSSESRRVPPASPPAEVNSPQPSSSIAKATAPPSPSADPHFSLGWAKPLPDGFLYFNDSLSKLGRAPVEAVVVPATHGARFYLEPRSKQVSYFTPTLEQVFKVNTALLLVAKQEPRISERIIDYRYQLVGIEQGERRIFVNAFCRDHQRSPKSDSCYYAFRLDNQTGAWVSWPADTCPPQEWLRKPVSVDDGGACYFNFTYHPQTGAISDLQVNGEG